MLTAAEPTTALLAGFCDPLEPWDGDMAEAWLVLRGRHRAGRFAAELRQRGTSPGLADALEAGAARFFTLADYWHPAAGVLFKHRRFAARSDSHAAELALAWHERGLPGRWALGGGGEGQASRRFGGQAIEGALVSVECDGDECLIETESGRLHHFRREQGSWQASDRAPPRARPAAGLTVLDWPLRAASEGSDAGIAPSADHAGRIAAALDLLGAHAPAHLDWVRRLTAMVMPLACQGRTIRSWSSGDYPGLISLCGNGEPIEVAETLVHEASHQHFHALRQFGDLVVPGTDESAWSPVKNCLRPIEMILLSYHAFANVQLFFRRLTGAGRVGADFYVAHCAVLLEWRPQLEGALRAARSVTPMGHSLWRTLARRLDEDD